MLSRPLLDGKLREQEGSTPSRRRMAQEANAGGRNGDVSRGNRDLVPPPVVSA